MERIESSSNVPNDGHDDNQAESRRRADEASNLESRQDTLSEEVLRRKVRHGLRVDKVAIVRVITEILGTLARSVSSTIRSASSAHGL